MKVKVSYTVDLERVPDLITEILHECSMAMEVHSKEMKFMPHDCEKSLQAIKDTRLSLASVDESLQEASHLITGWHNTVNSSELPQELPQEAPGNTNEQD